MEVYETLSPSSSKKRRNIAILAVAVVVLITLPTIIYISGNPKITVTDGTSHILYTGPIGSNLNNNGFNKTWANATIIQKTAPESYFILSADWGQVFRGLDPSIGNVTTIVFPVTFEGVLAGDLHPSSVSFSISTNGSSGDTDLLLVGTRQMGVNVSYSQKNDFQLSFTGNSSVTSTFGLKNVPIILFSSSSHTYRFNYTAEFISYSLFEQPFVRNINLTVTLKGLPAPVSDSIVIDVSNGTS